MPALRRIIGTAATTIALAAAALAPTAAVANPTPKSAAADLLVVSLPAIGGVEVGPGGVPGGSFAPVQVTFQRAQIYTLQYPPPPPAVLISVRNPAPYHYMYSYRYLSVAWRNLATGKSGVVHLRHWRTPTYKIEGHPATLPTSAIASTGGGPVTFTVNVLRTQYAGPPATISVVPGLGAAFVA